MSVRRDGDKGPENEPETPWTVEPKNAGDGPETPWTVQPKGSATRPEEPLALVEQRQPDPATVFGLIHRTIEDNQRLARLCVLLVVVAIVLTGMALFTPPDFLLAVLSLLNRGRV